MKQKCKIAIYICLLMILWHPEVFAQKALLRHGGADADVRGDKAKEEVVKNLKERSKDGVVQIFAFDAQALRGESLEIEFFPGKPVIFHKDEIELRGPEDLSWYGHTDDRAGGTAVLVYLNGELAGSVTLGNKKYILSPLGRGKCTVYESNDNRYPDDHPTKEDGLFYTPDMDSDQSGLADAGGTCKVRVLVAYTAAAQSGAASKGFSDMKLFIQQAVSETNQSYINSLVGHRLELAVCIRANYTESGSTSTDLSRFSVVGDGFMEHVHTYRTLYAADMCVLVINNPEYCGLASTIRATASNAFCTVHYDCATGYYSFGHELGHLYGCRHNPEVDNSTTPYAYGHGYNNIPRGWRTIMAYNDDANPTTRIQYWSNPEVTYGGFAMGDATLRNNARVLNERDAAVAAFYSAPATLTLNTNGRVLNGETGDAVASQSIVLGPGFTSANGSSFKASVGTCSGGFRIGSALAASTGKAAANTAEVVNVFPNPSPGAFALDINYATEKSVKVAVFNTVGERVYSQDLGRQSNIKHVVELSGYPAGVYMVTIHTDGDMQSRELVLIK